jgi:beta-lactamase superfamily II metal-dependent hydrolase
VGENTRFRPPVLSIVERYEHDGVGLLRTNRDGAVTALTDQRRLSVRTFRETVPN